MSRYILFVLLLTTAVALAEDKPKSQKSSGGTAAHKKTEAAQGQAEHAQTKMRAPGEKTKESQTKTEDAQAQADEPQPKKEEAQGETEEAQATTDEGAKLTSVPGGKALGMSILGNQDAPKALVIVPWKASDLGASAGNSPMLDDSRQPVDKEVFMRALRYYEIRSGTKP
jgi:hypothetical protein